MDKLAEESDDPPATSKTTTTTTSSKVAGPSGLVATSTATNTARAEIISDELIMGATSSSRTNSSKTQKRARKQNKPNLVKRPANTKRPAKTNAALKIQQQINTSEEDDEDDDYEDIGEIAKNGDNDVKITEASEDVMYISDGEGQYVSGDNSFAVLAGPDDAAEPANEEETEITALKEQIASLTKMVLALKAKQEIRRTKERQIALEKEKMLQEQTKAAQAALITVPAPKHQRADNKKAKLPPQQQRETQQETREQAQSQQQKQQTQQRTQQKQQQQQQQQQQSQQQHLRQQQQSQQQEQRQQQQPIQQQQSQPKTKKDKVPPINVYKMDINETIEIYNVGEIVVTWSTRDDTQSSIVKLKKWQSESIEFDEFEGESQHFIDGGHKKRSQYIHKVRLSGLQAQTKYAYTCGSALGWSAVFWFTLPPNKADWSPSLAIFGDLGNENAQSLSRLQADTQQGMYDAVIHVGDFAYDMDSANANVGDEFMRQIESVAAYLPYMVCPGNHEEKYNFSNYKSRFTMPGDSDSMWYSFDLGPVHFISYSTEVYYFVNYGIKSLIKQFEWLENDLKEATKPENRAIRPWIVTYGHRPMYCSDDKEYDCNEHLETYIRKGLPWLQWFGLEDLFYNYGVDVEIMAHEHFYTRLWPIYDFKVYNGSKETPYTNPGAPVQIITGSAGCKEKREPFSHDMPEWNAFHSNDYGYTRMRAYNGTHLYFEQVSDDKNGEIIDSIWIIKEMHGVYKKK